MRYLAYEPGPKGIRVHVISPGPIKTCAAFRLSDFDELLQQTAERAPIQRRVTIGDVGIATAYFASDAARLITGETTYVDGGYHIVG